MDTHLTPFHSLDRPANVITTRLLLLSMLAACLTACSLPGKGLTSKESALSKLSEGDTTTAFRILQKMDWNKNKDPELLLLLARLYRAEGTIIGRLKSQNLLELGLGKFPNNPMIRLELGKTHYAQTFYPDAERFFRSALTSEATACEAHYCLAVNHFRKWKRNQQFIDELEDAAEHFECTIHCSPFELKRMVEYAVCLYCLGDTSLSNTTCLEIIRRDSSVSTAHFLLGTTAFRHRRFEESNRSFQKALSFLPDEEAKTYLDITVLLSTDERFEYEKALPAERKRLNRMFWFAQDPDPTTVLNECFLEHIARTFLADLYFSTDRPSLRGWETERGKALIKFGWPSQMYRTLARMTTNIIDGWAEVWSYGEHMDGMELVFVDEFLNNALTIPRSEAYTHMAQMLVNSPAISSFEVDAIDIPGALDVVAFKNNSFSSSLYLTAGIDADSMHKALEVDKIDEYIVRGIFFDASWNEHHRFADTLSGLDVFQSGEYKREWFYAVKEFTLPFDIYRISCALLDLPGSAQGIFKDVASSLRFFSDSLTLSDILLYRDPQLYPRAPRFNREGITFVPNPQHEVDEGNRLRVYFEIYNLARYRSFSEYDVSYMIFEQPGAPEKGGWMWLVKGLKWFTGVEDEKTPFIVQTATRLSYETPVREVMAINIDSLKVGKYLLKVSVFDKHSGYVAEIATLFSKKTRTKQAR